MDSQWAGRWLGPSLIHSRNSIRVNYLDNQYNQIFYFYLICGICGIFIMLYLLTNILFTYEDMVYLHLLLGIYRLLTSTSEPAYSA